MEKPIDSTSTDPTEIILFDSSATLDDLKTVLKNQKIITFDVESHELLAKNNIDHEISDIYSQDKLDYIQKLTYKFSKWYEEPHIAHDITYEEINLGSLFYDEFHHFLVPFLKKFYELLSIVDKYRNCNFVAAPFIHRLVLCLSADKAKTIGKDYLTNFLYDSFKIKISNSISVNLSAENYLRLKNMSEKIISSLFKPKITKNRKSVLLVEFDPIKYKRFLQLSKSRLHLTFFNRRRPVVWNAASFLAIQKSKCGSVTHHNIINNKIMDDIKNKALVFDKKVATIIDNNEDFFKKFFTISGVSFWPALKPFFLKLCEKRIPFAISEIEITKKIFAKYRFDVVLVWSENGFNEQIAIGLAKKQKIPVILLQHGLYYDSPEALEFNKFAGVLPISTDIIACWGNSFKKSLERYGFQSEKIKVIGHPPFDDIFEIKNSKKNEFVLLVTSSPTKNIASDLSVQTRLHYIDCISKICKILMKNNKNLTVKLHPFAEEIDITDVVKSINHKISVVKKDNIINFLKLCEFVIVIDISTVIIEAQILKKPVISFSVKNYNLGNPEIFTSNAVIQTNLNDFETTLNNFLHTVDRQKKLVDSANKFLDNYLSNQGNASQKLIEFLEEI
ncbi:MAG: hypothetical protein QW177_04405 [Candidatus Nitrosotenuis sp.]